MTGSEPSDDDIDLFYQAVGPVAPLKVEPTYQQPRRPHPHPVQSERDQQAVMQALLSPDYDPEVVQPGDSLSYCVPGVTRAVFRKLRRGQYRIESELDLHGLSSTEAQLALTRFLSDCRRAGRRTLRIIHGKGKRSSNDGPVLKNRINIWLRQRQEVLAFCSARPTDGGTGAVYVLLRSVS